MLITTLGRQRGRWVARVYQGRRLLLVARGSRNYVVDAADAFCVAWRQGEQATTMATVTDGGRNGQV